MYVNIHIYEQEKDNDYIEHQPYRPMVVFETRFPEVDYNSRGMS